MPERVILGIGTKKGLFVAESAKTRKRLQVLSRLGSGPDHPTLAGVRPPPALIVTRVLATA